MAPRIAFVLSLLLCLSLQASAQSSSYRVYFPNRVHHQAQVEARFSGLPAGPATVRMARSSPGRYALHEFVKNVFDVQITDGAGRPLRVERPDPYSWRVPEHRGTVVMRYTLFGDRADGTYVGITPDFAHLNMPASFVYADALAAAPFRVTFGKPDPAWQIVTQLPQENDSTFTAPNLQYFMDSPTVLGPFAVRTWQVPQRADGSGKSLTIRLAVLDEAAEANIDRYADMVKPVVLQQRALFGALPDYDYGTYTFICNYWDAAAGDGMEHRNSTVCSAPVNFAAQMADVLGTVSHEFIHGWNVERMRPADLEPFDFSRVNMSDCLWFAEGFTSYLDDLMRTRADVLSQPDYLAQLGSFLGSALAQPGRRFGGPVDMSRQAAFADAAVSIDPNYRSNTFVSYYTYGAILGLALDLEIRTRFPGKSLDDLMREMYRRHPSVDKPYRLPDIQAALAAVTDAPFAETFFARSVLGNTLPEYAPLFAQFGLRFAPAHPGRGWVGQDGMLAPADGGVQIRRYTLIGTPLYEAGIDIADRITHLGGTPVASPDAFVAAVQAAAPGTRLPVRFVRENGAVVEAVLTVVQDPAMALVPASDATPEQLQRRNAWLGAK